MVLPHELGPFFEDFTVGDQVRPLPTLTLTEADNTAYRAVTGDQHALTADRGLLRAVGGEGTLANPGLVAHVSIGQTTNATRRAIANLYYRSVRILRPVASGETLRTTTTVLGKRSSSPKDGQHRGKVWLGITTEGDHGECMRYERCALVPARGTGPEETDEIPGPSEPTPLAELASLIPAWNLSALERTEWASGETRIDPLRDHVDLAAPFARLTFNQAAVHRDRTLPAAGRRLVYGGHIQALAQASLTRILPGTAQIVAWDGCDHVGPAFEDDLVEFSHQLVETLDVSGGRLLRLSITGSTVDGGAGEILRWTPIVFAP
ncbi:MAG: hypothetical protein EBR65_00055 [Actinobacteria bacterium]|jgi:2-methylfumaryl-CoA hydratase|nr:hypothetical protein [Actinomycetota bacterium]